MKFFLVGLVALLAAVVGMIPSAGAAQRDTAPAVSQLGSGDSWECEADYRSGPNVVVRWDLVDGSSSDWVWQYDISFEEPDNVVFSAHGSWTTFDDDNNPLPDLTPESYWMTSYRADGTSETYPCEILRNGISPVRPTTQNHVAIAAAIR